MKRGLLVLLALMPLAAPELPPVQAGVYRWQELQSSERAGWTVRPILSGSTLDLASLVISAITIAAGAPIDSGSAHDSTELFLMVKEGALRVSMNGVSKVLGAGSVAVALPGDRQILANAGPALATYYQFSYRSKAPMDLARAQQAGGSFMVDWSDLTERPTGSGTRRDVLNRPTAMFKRFEAHVSSVKAGLRNHATHSHRAEEFMMLTKGEVEVLIGEARLPASASDIVFLGTQIPHSLGNTGAGPTQYLVIQGE